MADQLGLSADQPQPPPMLLMHAIIHPEATQVGHETDQPRQPSSAHPIALQNPPIPIQQAAPFNYYQQSPHAPNPNFYYDDPLVSQHLSGQVLDQTTEMGILHHHPSVLPGGTLFTNSSSQCMIATMIQPHIPECALWQLSRPLVKMKCYLVGTARLYMYVIFSHF